MDMDRWGILLFVVLCGFSHLISGNSIKTSDSKVSQTSEMSFFFNVTANSNASMFASGEPAGILATGGSVASFGDSSVITQHQPTNTSQHVGRPLNTYCGGGQLSAILTGQEMVGLNSTGNCSSIIISNILNRPRPKTESGEHEKVSP